MERYKSSEILRRSTMSLSSLLWLGNEEKADVPPTIPQIVRHDDSDDVTAEWPDPPRPLDDVPVNGDLIHIRL